MLKMGKIVPLPAKEIVKILEKYGFRFAARGRHDKYRNEEKKISVPVPVSHGVISRGVIQSLIRQTGIHREEFEV